MTWRLGMARPDPSDRSNWSVVIPVLQEAQAAITAGAIAGSRGGVGG